MWCVVTKMESSRGGDHVPSTQFRTHADVTEELYRIEIRRIALQEAMRELDVEEARAKRAWNAMLPVNSLPNELLVAVFKLDAEDPELFMDGRLPYYYQWLRLMLVCARWRDVICATPTFWTRVWTTRNTPAWLDLCLARSAGTSLRISLYDPSSEVIQKLAPHTERLQDLNISYAEDFLSISHLISQSSMSTLQTLDISVNQGSVGVHITAAHYPALRSLRLFGVDLPSDHTAFANLRRLALGDFVWPRADYEPSHLLSILRSATRLEELSITKMLGSFRNNEHSSEWLPVHFPHLSEFLLRERFPIDIALFLTHLRLPPACAVTIFAQPEIEDFMDDFADNGIFPTIAAMLPTNRTEVLPMLSSSISVELLMREADYTLQGHPATREGRGGTIMLGVACERNGPTVQDWEPELDLGLDELTRVFEGAPVTRLRVTGDHECSEGLPDAWASVFEAFPTLETLELSGKGSGSLMWEGMGVAQSSAFFRPFNTMGLGQYGETCSNLRTVIIDGPQMTASRSFFEVMLDCLRRRDGHAPPLEVLRVRLGPMYEQDGERMIRQYSEEVQKLVGNFLYEFYYTI